MLKKIFGSRVFRICLSLVLIYFAFKKVDVVDLWSKLIGVEWWFVVLNIILSLISLCLVSFRWSMLLIKKPKFRDVIIFTKSSLSASFYGLFFPTSVAVDLLKWVIIDEKYPNIPKSKLLGSVALDRFIGLSMFMLVGLLMIFLGGGGEFVPLWVKLIFLGLFLGCLIFYLSLFFFDWSKVWKFKFLKRFENLSELVEKGNIGQIFKSLGVSLLSECFWIFQMWFIGWYFNTGLSIVSIFVFLPIISMILALPISFAGFGAREQLYILFFGGLASSSVSVLLMSTFSGIIGILMALSGGLVALTPDFKKSRNAKL